MLPEELIPIWKEHQKRKEQEALQELNKILNQYYSLWN